jgi:hypothetical protein
MVLGGCVKCREFRFVQQNKVPRPSCILQNHTLTLIANTGGMEASPSSFNSANRSLNLLLAAHLTSSTIEPGQRFNSATTETFQMQLFKITVHAANLAHLRILLLKVGALELLGGTNISSQVDRKLYSTQNMN